MPSKTHQTTQCGCGHDSIPKNISFHCLVDDVSSSDEQIVKDTYGPTKRTKTDNLKPIDDVKKGSAVEHSSFSEVPASTSSTSSPIAESEVVLTSASTTPITSSTLNKEKGHADNSKTVDDSVHALPKSSPNFSSTLSSPPENKMDSSFAIPVTSTIFAVAAAPTDALLKHFP
ncbi:hypothetical protein C1645_736368 [Glomus cerebriforme]|uniref:Uncharacterized protein n=1 Tax=Glomus cerebriforme TaxID=658196 RepID=A0A397TC43_9GLOM|nr:hypothetical protein C1645_736368 [Glomus cerebriforme]